MTWIGWDDYDPPAGLLGASIYPTWVSENELVVFSIGYTIDDPGIFKLYSQRCAVDGDGKLTAESEQLIRNLAALGSDEQWTLAGVQVNSDGHLLVSCFPVVVSSG